MLALTGRDVSPVLSLRSGSESVARRCSILKMKRGAQSVRIQRAVKCG